MELVLLALIGLGVLGSLSLSSTTADEDDEPMVDDEAGDDEVGGSVMAQQDDPQASLQIFDMNTIEWDNPEQVNIVTGSSGDDSIQVGAGPETVVRSEGSDTIDASQSDRSLVFAGEGDVVFSSDNPEAELNNNVIVGRDGAVVMPGAAGTTIFSLGEEGIVANAGAGDDLLVSDSGASFLNGGEGNDTIFGQGEAAIAGVGDQSHWDLADENPDTLIGGEGADLLVLSGLDLANGGSDEDTFMIYGAKNVIEDFDLSEDELTIFLDEVPTREDISLDERFDLVPYSEGVDILFDGEEILELKGVMELGLRIIDETAQVELVIGTQGWDGNFPATLYLG